MLEGLFLAVAGAVFSYVIEKLEPAEQIRKWLKREPAPLAFQKALSRAYTAFARQYPEYTASLFDQSFLSGKGAPELAKLLTRHLHPDPALFAQAWGTSIGFDIHSPFCKEATKPAADFLKWLEAELKSEIVFQPIFDSRALERLPNLESQIEKLTTELKRGFDVALKTANDYEKIILEIGGDIKDSNIIVGNNNQISVSNVYNHYHIGAFATLNDYYIPPDAVFQRVRVDEFVGRDWLTAKVDAFLHDPRNKSGIFLLVGEAGVGKTSFMAHLVKERRYLHLFAEQVPGNANLQRALQSFGSQLVTRYQIDPYKDRDTLTQLAAFPDFLDKLLRLAANKLAQDEKIVIVCDALDEAGTAPDGNVFGLPNVLPDNIYLILSQRPVSTKLPNVHTQTTTLDAQGGENLQDMQEYLRAVTKRPEIAGQLRSKKYSDEFFIRTLKEKSLGVWMYLHYIIEEVGKGSRAPLELENLPTGLVGYYADYWNDWRDGKNGRGEVTQKWDEVYAPLLTTLAAAREPITIEQLTAWAGIQTSKREVTRLLHESWRSFLTIREWDTGTLYAPYHASFRDFLTGKADRSLLRPAEMYLAQELADQTQKSHQRIVNLFRKECNGNWEKLVDQEYIRLHLTSHLTEANEYSTLINLLTEGKENIDWAEALYKNEETYAGFLNDLEYVWKYAQGKDNLSLQVRCMLIENSIRSLAKNIPALLLTELGKTGLWSYAKCLTMIKQIPESYQQAAAIIQLAPNIPQTLLEEALYAAREIKDESSRIDALASLISYVGGELKGLLLSSAHEIKDEADRAQILCKVALYLDYELREQVLAEALFTVREIENEFDRASALSKIAPYFNNELQVQVLKEALSIARESKNEFTRNHILSEIAPHLNGELQAQVLKEALSSARESKNESNRAYTFSKIVPYLNDELQAQVLEEALFTALELEDEDAFFPVLSRTAPYLNDDLKATLLAVAREFEDESDRAYTLSIIAPYLNDDLKATLLSIAREFEAESNRAYTLTEIAPYLNDDLRTQVLKEALYSARQIKDESNRANALTKIAPYLNDELRVQVLKEALSGVREIEDESDRAYTLSKIAPYLNDDLKATLLSIAREIKDESDRANTLTEVAPFLNDELRVQVLKEALSSAREIEKEFSRLIVFSKIVPHLNDELRVQVLKETLSSARQIRAGSDRAYILSEIAPYLNNEFKTTLFSAVCEIKDEYFRLVGLSKIVPYLNNELKALALEEVRFATREEVEDEIDRARFLTEIAPYLTDELKAILVSAAQEIEEEYSRLNLLSEIIPYLNDELKAQVLEEVLASARKITGESGRATALSNIVPYLDDELKAQVLEEVLASARKITGESGRATALSNIALYFNDEQRAKVVVEVTGSELKDKHTRAYLLSKIAIAFKKEIGKIFLREVLLNLDAGSLRHIVVEWEQIQFRGLRELLTEFLRNAAYEDRSEGLSRIAAMLPAIVHFESKEISGEILRAIIDTARWWP